MHEVRSSHTVTEGHIEASGEDCLLELNWLVALVETPLLAFVQLESGLISFIFANHDLFYLNKQKILTSLAEILQSRLANTNETLRR